MKKIILIIILVVIIFGIGYYVYNRKNIETPANKISTFDIRKGEIKNIDSHLTLELLEIVNKRTVEGGEARKIILRESLDKGKETQDFTLIEGVDFNSTMSKQFTSVEYIFRLVSSTEDSVKIEVVSTKS